MADTVVQCVCLNCWATWLGALEDHECPPKEPED